MGQQEIGDALNLEWPRYLPYQELVERTNTGKSSVITALRCMLKRNEIQTKTVWGKNPKTRWETLYRINKDI